MRLSSLTLSLTAFNEADALKETVKKALEALPKLAFEYELLIIDDGSTDETPKIAEDLAKENATIHFVRHAQNMGMGAAIQTAIENASQEWFCTIAADGQVDPNELQAFLASAKTNDAVFSTYSTRRDGLDRWVLSNGVRVLLYFLAGVWKVPTGNYFIKLDLLRKLKLRSTSFVLNYEVFLEVRKLGIPFSWTELPCQVRKSGRSRVRNLRNIWWVFREILAYRLRQES